jgi:copper transport protein
VGFGLLLTPGLSGHASTGSTPVFGIALDVLHLGAVAVWFGGLAVLGALLVPGLSVSSGSSDVRPIAMKFSSFAFASVIVVVATGVIQSIRQVGSFYALFHTSYGTTLLVKIGLVIILIALGAVSRRVVLGGWMGPLLARSARSVWRRIRALAASPQAVIHVVAADVPLSAERLTPGSNIPGVAPTEHETAVEPGQVRCIPGLRASVFAEIAIALVVLAVTALLVNAVPAKQAANQPFSQSFNVLGVQVNVIVAPAKTGPGNQFHFYVLGRLGEPMAIPELDASISLPSQAIGPLAIPLVVASPGHFRASNVDIPIAGSWNLEITVRTSPIDEQSIDTVLPIH